MKYILSVIFISILCVFYVHYNPQYFGGQILGVANPNVTQENIHDTICIVGFTATIRPPTSYTSPLKLKLCKQQNCGDVSKYELDHRIALTDGGAPSDPNNLWLQPYPEAYQKDRLEIVLNKKICNYELTLVQGQAMLKGNWKMYYDKYIGNTLGAIDVPDPDDI